jgi:hypothetical protein
MFLVQLIDNYRMIISLILVPATTSGVVSLRMRASGADIATTPTILVIMGVK